MMATISLAGYVLTEEEGGVIRVVDSETQEEVVLNSTDGESVERYYWSFCHNLIRFHPRFNANMQQLLKESMLKGITEAFGTLRNFIDVAEGDAKEKLR